MSEQAKLLPCPFCGEQPEMVHHEYLNSWMVGCKNRRCPLLVEIHASNKDRAIKVWNTRKGSSIPIAGTVS